MVLLYLKMELKVLFLLIVCFGAIKGDYDYDDDFDDYDYDGPDAISQEAPPSTEQTVLENGYDPEDYPDIIPKKVLLSTEQTVQKNHKPETLYDSDYGVVETTTSRWSRLRQDFFSPYAFDYDPMTSHVSPDDQQLFSPNPYTITEMRLQTIRRIFMYPYYDQSGISSHPGDHQKEIMSLLPKVYFNFQLPFLGFRFNYTQVSLNGFLEFSDTPPNFEYPMKGWPENDDPFIGIFLSKYRIGNLRDEDTDRREPGVYFRIERDLTSRKDQMGVEIRERLKWDIREGIIGAEAFEPTHAIIVTWKNMSFDFFNSSLYLTNTFQMVLATDEVYTYAMFNYDHLTEIGQDTIEDGGGVPVYVGFNAGTGIRNGEYTPYSRSPLIRNLTSHGYANGFPGRHIFRIDETILVGSCNGNYGLTHCQQEIDESSTKQQQNLVIILGITVVLIISLILVFLLGYIFLKKKQKKRVVHNNDYCASQKRKVDQAAA